MPRQTRTRRVCKRNRGSKTRRCFRLLRGGAAGAAAGADAASGSVRTTEVIQKELEMTKKQLEHLESPQGQGQGVDPRVHNELVEEVKAHVNRLERELRAQQRIALAEARGGPEPFVPKNPVQLPASSLTSGTVRASPRKTMAQLETEKATARAKRVAKREALRRELEQKKAEEQAKRDAARAEAAAAAEAAKRRRREEAAAAEEERQRVEAEAAAAADATDNDVDDDERDDDAEGDATDDDVNDERDDDAEGDDDNVSPDTPVMAPGDAPGDGDDADDDDVNDDESSDDEREEPPEEVGVRGEEPPEEPRAMFDPVADARQKLNAFMIRPHTLTTGPLEGWTQQITRLNNLAQLAHNRAEAARRAAIPPPVRITDTDDNDDNDDASDATENPLTGGKPKKFRTMLRAPRKASGSKPRRPKLRRSK